MAEMFGDGFDGARDLRQSFSHGCRDFGVFTVNEARNFEGGTLLNWSSWVTIYVV